MAAKLRWSKSSAPVTGEMNQVVRPVPNEEFVEQGATLFVHARPKLRHAANELEKHPMPGPVTYLGG